MQITIRRDLCEHAECARWIATCLWRFYPPFPFPPSLLAVRYAGLHHPPKISDHIVPIETVDMEVFTMAKSVLIAEDHTLVRQAICSLFDAQQDFEVCGDAENGKEAVEMAQVLHPDLIVLDLEMPVMNGLEAAHALRRFVPETPILLFSEYSDLLSEHEAHAQGISALVSKGEPVSVLLNKARAALASTAEMFL